MSRSVRKPIAVCSTQIDKHTAHKTVRRKVKSELKRPDPDPTITYADTREMDLEDFGTKLGFDTSEILANDTEQQAKMKKKLSRK